MGVSPLGRRGRRMSVALAGGVLLSVLFISSVFAACSGPSERDQMFDDVVTPSEADTTISPAGPTPTLANPTEVELTIPPDVMATESPVEANPTASATPERGTSTPTRQSATPTSEPATASPTPSPTPTVPESTFDPAAVSLALELVGSGFREPTFITHAGDGSGTLYVLEKPGRIRFLNGETFLDITDRVIDTGLEGNEREQGLLGLAFHPEFESNRQFFVHYNDENGDTVLSRFTAGPEGLGNPTSEEILLTLDQPATHFNGGMITFGPDGYLYVGMGTGGGRDEDFINAQDPGSLFGKLLRIDVDSGNPYGMPPDNPYIGDETARPEVWAIGLRNPWRFSFDRATGDIYIADAGQFNWEWIHFQPADSEGGENYGWPIYEGTHCFVAADCEPPPNYRPPILEYARGELGCVVIGGYVYRGAAYPDLYGAYLYSDFCSSRVWAAWRDQPGEWQSVEIGQVGALVSSFGEDEAGELYLVNIADGEVYQLHDDS